MADIREITPSRPTWPVRQRDPAEQRKQQPPAQPRQPPPQERSDDEDDQHIDDYA